MDAHFAAYFQIQHLRCTCARRMLASDQKWQEGIGVALTVNKGPKHVGTALHIRIACRQAKTGSNSLYDHAKTACALAKNR
jgi:hypothetical protein